MKNSLRLTLITPLAAFNLSAATLHVGPGGFSTIQDAVDAAAAGDRILVTNGVYATGGRAVATSDSDNRVLVNKAVTVQSINGPQFTVIRGDRLILAPPPGEFDAQVVGPRCVLLYDGAILSGFTLTNGTAYGGGGVTAYSTNAIITNCVIVGNWAPGYTANGLGGGAYGGALYNCVLTGNTAAFAGGGAAYSTLYNCVVTSNQVQTSASVGGGAYSSTLYNCTVTGNSAGSDMYGGICGGVEFCTLYNSIVCYNTVLFSSSDYDSTSTLTNCWTSASPLFVDYANGNLRLQSNSPCINAGTNFFAARPTDLDGRPRVVGGRVDIGAYEFQPSVSGAFIGWLQQYGLPTDGSADYTDSDNDRMNNWQEWVCGTSPTDPLSVLRLLSATPAGTDVSVSWQSVAGVNYLLARGADLAVPFTSVATNIPGQAGTTSYTDTNAAGVGPFFYRVEVQSP